MKKTKLEALYWRFLDWISSLMDKGKCDNCGEPYDLHGFNSTVCQNIINGKKCNTRNY